MNELDAKTITDATHLIPTHTICNLLNKQGCTPHRGICSTGERVNHARMISITAQTEENEPGTLVPHFEGTSVPGGNTRPPYSPWWGEGYPIIRFLAPADELIIGK